MTASTNAPSSNAGGLSLRAVSLVTGAALIVLSALAGFGVFVSMSRSLLKFGDGPTSYAAS